MWLLTLVILMSLSSTILCLKPNKSLESSVVYALQSKNSATNKGKLGPIGEDQGLSDEC